jgi:hypothetical protein
MRAAVVRQLVIEAVLEERERCAKICDDRYGAPEYDEWTCEHLASEIRSIPAPQVRFIRPETAEKNPELLNQGYRVAGQGLSADGQRIIGNGKGSEPCQPPR